MLASAVSLLVLILVGFDRNYIGVHFYFQVVLGYALGACVASGLSLDLTQKVLAKMKNNLRELMYFEVIMGICYLIGILVYFFRDPYVDPYWSNNYEDKCSGSIHEDKIMFKSLNESSCILINSGFFLGLYYFKPASHSKKSRCYYLVVLLFLVVAAIEQSIEYGFKFLDNSYEFLGISILRLLFGFVVPLMISKFNFYFAKSVVEEESSGSVIEAGPVNHKSKECYYQNQNYASLPSRKSIQ